MIAIIIKQNKKRFNKFIKKKKKKKKSTRTHKLLPVEAPLGTAALAKIGEPLCSGTSTPTST